MTPPISVVMTVYNEADIVESAIDSILDQTVEEFEFIIVDDGSTDGTVNRIEAVDDPRITLLKNERNRGLAPSLNRGIDAATGEYIARMDADDRSLPTRLERQLAFMEAHDDVQVAGCWYRITGPAGESFGEIQRGEAHNRTREDVLRAGPGLPHGSAMIRRDAFDSVGGYDEQYTLSQDLDLWLRIGAAYGPGFIRNVPAVLYERQISPEMFRKVPLQRLYGMFARTAALGHGDRERVPERFLETVRSSDDSQLSARRATSNYHRLAAQQLADRGETAEARAHYRTAIRTYPTNIIAWYGLVRSYLEL